MNGKATGAERFADLNWLSTTIQGAQNRLTAERFDAAGVDPVDQKRIKAALANAAACIHALKRGQKT
ncbi:MAG: hypothetical protein AAF619_08025 [Pseudomonadota bacterium]